MCWLHSGVCWRGALGGVPAGVVVQVARAEQLARVLQQLRAGHVPQPLAYGQQVAHAVLLQALQAKLSSEQVQGAVALQQADE